MLVTKIAKINWSCPRGRTFTFTNCTRAEAWGGELGGRCFPTNIPQKPLAERSVQRSQTSISPAVTQRLLHLPSFAPWLPGAAGFIFGCDKTRSQLPLAAISRPQKWKSGCRRVKKCESCDRRGRCAGRRCMDEVVLSSQLPSATAMLDNGGGSSMKDLPPEKPV